MDTCNTHFLKDINCLWGNYFHLIPFMKTFHDLLYQAQREVILNSSDSMGASQKRANALKWMLKKATIVRHPPVLAVCSY